MQLEWLEPVILGAMAFVVLAFFGLVLRKVRKRRREEFEEDVSGGLPGEDEPVLESEPDVLPSIDKEREPEADSDDSKTDLPREIDPALQKGIERTSESFVQRLGQVLGRKSKIDQSVLDELEEALLSADVGVGLTTRLVGELREELKLGTLESAQAVRDLLKERVTTALAKMNHRVDPLASEGMRPRVFLFVGVNGVGKTTTIGKVAAKLRDRGHSVVLAAGDTFRAAAVEQLAVWAERTESRLIRGETNADPASVIFNAIEYAKKVNADVVLADTAGRLHTKANLMEEIKKVKRVVGKAREDAPDEVWLVVDATTGQNAVQQARQFHDALGLTGVILTKLDGTAKGGVVIAIVDNLSLPVPFVGVGEKKEDLRPFVPEQFVEALFGERSVK